MTAAVSDTATNNNTLDAFGVDLSAPPKTRVKRAPKHDFKDGRGRVFAHRHDNGGGWVEDTAYVAPSAMVGRQAQVANFAKIFDNVQLTGKVKVRQFAKLLHNTCVGGVVDISGRAMLRDETNVSGEGVIDGRAMIMGTSRITNRFSIGEFAIVNQSTLEGPRQCATLQVYGNAQIHRSRVFGASRFNDSALLDEAVVQNCDVRGLGRLLRTQFSTFLDYRFNYYLNSRRFSDFAAAVKQFSEMTPPERVWRTVFTGVAINSHVSCIPAWFGDDVKLLSCHFHVGGTPGEGPLFLIPEQTYCDFRANSFDQIARYTIQPTANNVQNGAPVIAAIGAVPDHSTNRQRRLMRLDETP